MLSIILSYSLVLRPDCIALGATLKQNPMQTEVHQELRQLLNEHLEIKNGVGSFDLINKSGKKLNDYTFSFLADPKNSKILNTPEAKELIKHNFLLANYLSIKSHFEKCIKDPKAKRQLHSRVLQSAFQNMNTATPCLNFSKPFKSFNEFNSQIINIIKVQERPTLQNEYSKSILKNTAKSLIGFKYKFDPNFMKNHYMTQPELNGIMAEICNEKATTRNSTFSSCQNFSKSERFDFANELIQFSKTLPASGIKYSYADATQSLNKSIHQLNEQLNSIEVKTDKGFFYDSASLTDPKSKMNFDKYMNKYMNVVSNGAGPLLLTPTLKDKAGTIKSFSKDDTSKNSKLKAFKFDLHQSITEADTIKSIAEAKEKILDQARSVTAISKKKHYQEKSKGNFDKQRKEDIAELVKINPFAGGQILIQHPEYAGLMCEAINEVNENDSDKENFDHAFMIGTAILGGALLLTGVGTVAGAYILTGSMTAGIAAGTVGGSILATTTLVGGAVEVANVAHYTKRSYETLDEMNSQENAFLSGNGDNDSITDAKNALIHFKEARLSAGISLASLGLSALSAGRFLNILKQKEKVSPAELNKVTKILNVLSENSVGKKMKDVAKLLGSSAGEKIDQFLYLLAKTGESTRIKILELLKDAKMTPTKLKEIIEDALAAAKNC